MINIDFSVNLTEILNKELVGKMHRYCCYSKPIIQPSTIYIKKVGATHKQFRDNPKKVSIIKRVEAQIGWHHKFEESKIVRIIVHNDYEDGISVTAELENGEKVLLSLI